MNTFVESEALRSMNFDVGELRQDYATAVQAGVKQDSELSRLKSTMERYNNERNETEKLRQLNLNKERDVQYQTRRLESMKAEYEKNKGVNQKAIDKSVQQDMEIDRLQRAGNIEQERQKAEGDLYEAQARRYRVMDHSTYKSEFDLIQRKIQTQELQDEIQHMEEITKQQKLRNKMHVESTVRAAMIQGTSQDIIARQLQNAEDRRNAEIVLTGFAKEHQARHERRMGMVNNLRHQHEQEMGMNPGSFEANIWKYFQSEDDLARMSDVEFHSTFETFKNALQIYWNEQGLS
jgi:hypothetical protein